MAGDSEEKEREAVGGFGSPVRHRQQPDDERDDRSARGSEHHPGPPGDVDTGAQVVHEDTDDDDRGGGTDEMTTAETTGEVAYGDGEPTGNAAPQEGGTSG